MTNRRGGTTTSVILALAGIVGVGVAGGMALTGTTPCALFKACGVKSDGAATTTQAVALKGDPDVCPITGKRLEATPEAPTSPMVETVALAGTDDEPMACCAGEGKAALIAAAATEPVKENAAAPTKNDKENLYDPGALRKLFTLEFSAKGMPMLVPALMMNGHPTAVKDAGACGGCDEEKGEGCGDCADEAKATTASLR